MVYIIFFVHIANVEKYNENYNNNNGDENDDNRDIITLMIKKYDYYSHYH